MANPIQWTELLIPNGGIDETKAPQTIEAHRWVSASNVEPMPDGLRSRRGAALQNSSIIQAIDLSYESGTAAEEFTDGADEYISQGFTTSGAISVDTVAVRLKKSTGSPTGNVTCAIYSDNSDEPGTVVTGADFTDFSTLDSSTTDSDFRWYRFTLGTEVSLTAATLYHLVIAHTGAVAGNMVAIQESASGNGYAGGRKNYSTDAATWTADANADLNFRIYDVDTGAVITGIADYRLADGSTTRNLIIAGGEVYKISGGTVTAVSGRERQVLDDTATVYPSHVVGNDRWYVTDNSAIAKKFYILSGTEYWENEGLAAPTTTASAAAGGAGDPVTDGTHYIDYYWWNNDLGIASDRRYGGVDTLSVVTTGQEIDISSLPAAPEREGDRATHLRIEIKFAGSSVYRLVESVAVGTTTATITGTEEDAATTEGEYEHAVPPVHRIKCVAENRQFIGDILDGSTRRRYRLMYSAVIGVNAYYESFPALNYRDFGKGDGDYMTALAFMYPQTLIVGFKNSIYAIDARRPGTSDVTVISRRVGIAGPHAVQVVGQRIFFLSDSAHQLGFYSWSPGMGEPKLLPGVDDTLKGLEKSRFGYASTAIYAPGDNRFQWWTLLTTASGTQHDTIMVYDYNLDAWTKYTLPATKKQNVIGMVETSNIGRIYSGDYGGRYNLRDSGSDDGGSSYTSTVKLKWFGFGSDATKKRLRWVEYVADNTATGSVSFTVNRDYGTESPISTTIRFSPGSGGLVWATGVWGTAIWPTTSDTTLRRALRGIGKMFQPVLSSSDQWHIKGLMFGVQPTRRS